MKAIIGKESMVSFEKIIQKFKQLDEFLGMVRKILKVPIKDFLKDKIIIGSFINKISFFIICKNYYNNSLTK